MYFVYPEKHNVLSKHESALHCIASYCTCTILFFASRMM